MKTKTALVLTAAGVLLTGSAALAVNVQTLNGPPAGTTPANTVLLPQNSTTATSLRPASTPTTSTLADRSPASSPRPSVADDRGNDNSAPSSPAAGGRTAAPSPAPVPAPARSRTNEPGDDHGGHGEPEPGDDKHSGSDD